MEVSYLQGETGYFMKRTNPLFVSVTPVSSNPEMPTIEESLKFVGKKIPGNVFRQWLAFARGVAQKNKHNSSEAALLLFYHPEKKEWDAYPPKQKLSAASVDYSGCTEAIGKFREKNGKAWMLAGTIHSHPGMSSSPSETDIKDEIERDGIHIIVPDFGRQDERGVTIHATAARIRFAFRKTSHLVDFGVGGELPVPDEWYSQISFGGVGVAYSYYRGTHYGYDYSGASSTLDYKWSKEHNLQKPKKVLRMLGHSKEQVHYLLKNYETIFEEACLILDKAKDHYVDVEKTNTPVSLYELNRFKRESEEVAAQMVEFIEDLATWLLPEKLKKETTEAKTETSVSGSGGTDGPKGGAEESGKVGGTQELAKGFEESDGFMGC